jgi:hypothetical protein
MWQVRTTDDWAAQFARLGLAIVMLPHDTAPDPTPVGRDGSMDWHSPL